MNKEFSIIFQLEQVIRPSKQLVNFLIDLLVADDLVDIYQDVNPNKVSIATDCFFAISVLRGDDWIPYKQMSDYSILEEFLNRISNIYDNDLANFYSHISDYQLYPITYQDFTNKFKYLIT